MTQRMTQDPDPAVPGEKVIFCYDIDGVSLPVDLKGEWSPGGQPIEHTVTKLEDRCFEIVVPDDAEGGVISSPDSDDFPVAVAP